MWNHRAAQLLPRNKPKMIHGLQEPKNCFGVEQQKILMHPLVLRPSLLLDHI